MNENNSHQAKPITVLVVDDHPLYRESIARIVRSRDDMEVVGEASEGHDAVELLRELRPTVCVLDYHLPGLDGGQVIDTINRENLDTCVIVLSGSGDSEIVYSMIQSGARGFLLKTAGAAEICDAIERVAAGDTVLPAQFHGGLAAEIRARQSDDRPTLSERELTILELIAKGKSTAEIGDSLALAPSTVKTHMSHIYEKLGVSERAAAVARAMRIGLIS